MQSYTKTGLLLLLVGMILGLIANVTLFFVSFLTSGSLSDLIPMMISALIAGTGGLLMLIGGLLIIIGRKEFGEKHQKYAIYAIVIFVVNIVITSVLSFSLNMMSLFGGESLFMVTIIPTVVSAIIGGLVYIFLLHELENQNGRYALFAAYFAAIAVSVVTALYTAGMFEAFFGSAFDPDISSTMSFVARTSRISILSLIHGVLLLIAAYIPYNRITSGELIPKKIELFEQQSSTPERVCPNCGRKIPTDAVNCPYCGKNFETFL